MALYGTPRTEIAVLTDTGWRGIPHVTSVRADFDDPTITDLLPQTTIPPETLGATAYRWGPGAWTQDQLTPAQPWSRHGSR